MFMQHIRYLHIIRGFAAFFVLLAHAKWPFWVGGSAFFQSQSLQEISTAGKLGGALALLSSNGTAMVVVFYVLSGFIVTHSYQKNNWSYKQFLVNRSLRIYIPYIASALLAGVLLYLSYKIAAPVYENPIKDYHQRVDVAYHEGLSFTNFIKTFFFIKTERVNYFGFNYVYWSLLYEMIFYAFFPFLLKYCKYLLYTTAIIFPVHIFYQPLPEINYWYLYLTQYLFYFLMGIALYKWVASPGFTLIKKHSLTKKPVLLIGIISLFLLSQLIGFSSFKAVSFCTAALLAAAWIIYILLYGVRGILVKPAVFLGTISYSLYLVHVPLLLFFYSCLFYVFQTAVYPSPWFYFLPALMTLPFAYIFYLVFEKLSVNLIALHKKRAGKKPVDLSIVPGKTVY
jgi:peptidoglycan/LPS O-acetylase OafA/YrhL